MSLGDPSVSVRQGAPLLAGCASPTAPLLGSHHPKKQRKSKVLWKMPNTSWAWSHTNVALLLLDPRLVLAHISLHLTTSLEPWSGPWGQVPVSSNWPTTHCKSPKVRNARLSVFLIPPPCWRIHLDTAFWSPGSLPSLLLLSYSQELLSMLITHPYSFFSFSLYICNAVAFTLPFTVAQPSSFKSGDFLSLFCLGSSTRPGRTNCTENPHALLLLFAVQKYSFECEDPFNPVYNKGSTFPKLEITTALVQTSITWAPDRNQSG